MKKRFLAIILAVLLIASALPFSIASAEEAIVQSGPITSEDANETVYYKIVSNDDGATYTLTFYETSPDGDGVIPEYGMDGTLNYNNLPWRAKVLREKITTIIFDSSITKIGKFTVANMEATVEYRIMNPSATVSNHAFYFQNDGCISDTGVVIRYYSGVTLPTSTFFHNNVSPEQKALVTYETFEAGEITDMITSNGDGTHTLTLAGSGDMSPYAGVTPWAAYNGTISAVVIGEGITSISSGAFSALTALETVDIAESVESIDEGAFPTASFTMKGMLNHASGTYAEEHSNVSLKLKKIRILHIGNSHTADHTQWMDIIIGDMYDNGMETEFERQAIISGARGLYTEVATDRGSHYEDWDNPNDLRYTAYQNAFAKTWDIVIAQDFRESTSTNETYGGANFADELAICVDWLHTMTPGAKIVWFADWAERSFNGGNFELSWSQSMAAIAAVNALTENKPDYIINAATILQNARTSYLAVTKNEAGVIRNWDTSGGFTDFATDSIQNYPILERDGTHMSLELGRYMMAEAVLWQLINEYGDYLDMSEDFDYFGCLKTTPEFTQNQSYWEGSFVPIYFEIFEEVARSAYSNPYSVTSVSEKYKTDPFDAMYASVKSVIAGVEVPSNPTKAELIAAYTAPSVISAINEINGITVTADDITVNYSASTTKRQGEFSVEVDCAYGYSTPAEPAVIKKLPLKELVVYGQFNNDGVIDEKDIGLLKKHLLNLVTLNEAADVSGEGNIDILDVVILKRYIDEIAANGKTDIILGPEVYLSVFNATPLTNTGGGIANESSYTYERVKQTEGRDRYMMRNTVAGSIGAKTIMGKNFMQLSYSSTAFEGKAALIYIEHVDAVRPVNINVFFDWRAVSNNAYYYLYDIDAGKWTRYDTTVSGYNDLGDHGDLIQRVSPNGSFHEIPADFKGWMLIPYESVRDCTAVKSFSAVRFEPQYLGGDYGSLIFGDVTIIDNIDPITEQEDLDKSVFISSNSTKLGSDFPFNTLADKNDLSGNLRWDQTQTQTQNNITTELTINGLAVKSERAREISINSSGVPTYDGSNRAYLYRLRGDVTPGLIADGAILVYVENTSSEDYHFITGRNNYYTHKEMPYYLLADDDIAWTKYYPTGDLKYNERDCGYVTIPAGFSGWLSLPVASLRDNHPTVSKQELSTAGLTLDYFSVITVGMGVGNVYFSNIGSSSIVTPTHFNTDTKYEGLNARITSGLK